MRTNSSQALETYQFSEASSNGSSDNSLKISPQVPTLKKNSSLNIFGKKNNNFRRNSENDSSDHSDRSKSRYNTVEE